MFKTYKKVLGVKKQPNLNVRLEWENGKYIPKCDYYDFPMLLDHHFYPLKNILVYRFAYKGYVHFRTVSRTEKQRIKPIIIEDFKHFCLENNI